MLHVPFVKPLFHIFFLSPKLIYNPIIILEHFNFFIFLIFLIKSFVLFLILSNNLWVSSFIVLPIKLHFLMVLDDNKLMDLVQILLIMILSLLFFIPFINLKHFKFYVHSFLLLFINIPDPYYAYIYNLLRIESTFVELYFPSPSFKKLFNFI